MAVTRQSWLGPTLSITCMISKRSTRFLKKLYDQFSVLTDKKRKRKAACAGNTKKSGKAEALDRMDEAEGDSDDAPEGMSSENEENDF